MSLLFRCAVTILILACSAACSGIPITEPGTDIVTYPSGCKDGCRQECPEVSSTGEGPAGNTEHVNLKVFEAFEAYTTAGSTVVESQLGPASVSMTGSLPFE